MNPKANAINWFEISVTDMNRAKKFYETIFGIDMGEVMEYGEAGVMAMFPSEQGSGKVSGALFQGPGNKTSMDGVKIYLNCDPDIQPVLDKVAAAGGSVTQPKTDLGSGWGFIAFITDSEGNQIGLHSNG